MTMRETPIEDVCPDADADERSPPPLELLVDEGTWTVTPIDATDKDRLTRWLSVDASVCCDLEAWR